MIISSEVIIVCIAAYLAVMFLIAYRGDKQPSGHVSKFQPIIYTLSIAVYCSSWTFYGAVGNAAKNGWDYFSIYLGPIIVFLFFFSSIKKIIAISKRHKTTTIADFISTRYGKSHRLAALVTIIALLGSMPYIALQLKAIAGSYDILIGEYNRNPTDIFSDTAFILALILAVFSILFGARSIDAAEHHRGMLYAISFESVIKLAAFVSIAILSFNIVEGLSIHHENNVSTSELLLQPFTTYVLTTSVFTKILLSAAAIICLPRQFHVLAVEARGGEASARWGVPAYLIIFSLAVIPITAAGSLVIQGANNADLYVLLLPMLENNNLLTIVSYLGGFAAATGMVIVANVALSTMVSNDLVFPLILRLKKDFSEKRLYTTLLFIRRTIIFGLMMMAYGFYHLGGTEQSLQGIGLISFAAAVQFLPSIIGGIYWRGGHKNGAIFGLLSGLGVWLYTLLLPSFSNSSWISTTFVNLLNNQDSLLNPHALLGIQFNDTLTHGVFWSLLINISLYLFFSLRSSPSLVDRLQAAAYVDLLDKQLIHNYHDNYSIFVSDLFELCSRFTGVERTKEYFLEHGYDLNIHSQDIADKNLQKLSSQLLSRSIGTATAEHLIRTAYESEKVADKDLFELIDQTGQAIEFNRELLQVTLDHIGQAVSVIDDDLRLVAWNRFYIELFDYPSGLISVGMPVEEVIRFNVERGYGPSLDGNLSEKISKRLNYLKHGEHYVFVRDWQNGLVIQTEGGRLPDGGYITTYTDITPLKMAERRLSSINETLEAKVVERTEMLSSVNLQLEEAINNKTHFLAAASHDLVQPLNASKLYMSALLEDLSHDVEKQDLARSSLNALNSAESLLKSLLHLSKLDSGVLEPDIQCFSVDEVFKCIENDFTVLAKRKGISLKVILSSKSIETDKSLLFSILQNLVANAIRYTDKGLVLVVCRRESSGLLRLEVRDSGQGILLEAQEEIFHPFKQFGKKHEDGVGLGLAICRQASILLGHMMHVKSLPGQGSVFSVAVPEVVGGYKQQPMLDVKQYKKYWLEGLNILCVDDDKEILEASKSLLVRWGANVTCTATTGETYELINSNKVFDAVLMDYQLGGKETGIDLLLSIKHLFGDGVVYVLVTAEQDPSLKEVACNHGFQFLAKPVEPAKLRALLQSGLSDKHA